MRAFNFIAPLVLAASSLAQAVEEGIAPDTAAPQGCKTTVQGDFTIGVQNFFAPGANKRETAQEAADGLLLCSLEGGVLRDQHERTGSVVANYQFQFDGPPQAGAIYTGGFSVCQNQSLALGGSTRWWRCMSGEFGNLYDRSIGEQCTEIRILVDMVDKPSPSISEAVISSTVTSHRAPILATSASSVSHSHTGSTSRSMTSGAPTGTASQMTSASVSPTGTVTSNSTQSAGSSDTSVPEAPEANSASFLRNSVALWSTMASIGAIWIF